MRVAVITGGIGAGKSTAARYLAEKGAVVIDSDEVALSLLVPGSRLLAKVADEFGPDVLLADGSLDRAALARAAFAAPGRASRLNALVHPAVSEALELRLAELRALPEAPAAVVVEVPLLAEAPQIASLADVVVAIVAPQQVRVGRAAERGMTEADAKRRAAAQASDAERASLADEVVINDGSLERFLSEVDRIWRTRLAGM